MYLQPRRPSKVDWRISDQVQCIVEYYAKYSAYSEEYVVEEFLKNLLGDPVFADFLKSQRRTKRMVQRIFSGDGEMKLIDQYSSAVTHVRPKELSNEEALAQVGILLAK